MVQQFFSRLADPDKNPSLKAEQLTRSQVTVQPEVIPELLTNRRQHIRNGPATLLPRLEDSKMIGMIDEDAPKKAKGQQSVEV